jgi:uncharacterized protein YbcC (UPF0753/DUF2309 family)
MMANRAEVRDKLAARGIRIPKHTWFIGGERNTASSNISLYDLEVLPSSHTGDLERARAAFDEARIREAAERCRRFHLLARERGPRALRKVEARSRDLAQPRPEYGHATNAFCFIGRRATTRGLFLDRRAFLMSYDPGADEQGKLLSGVLGSVVPVVAGINLEYYFGTVDNEVYGCGTKLPHNIVSLLGVMNGPSSDLRTGLPWQMVEIHEPVRLSIVVECKRDRLKAILDELPQLARLVRNRWVFLACLDPERQLWEVQGDEFQRHEPAAKLARVDGPSENWFFGRDDHLDLVSIVPPRQGAAREEQRRP